MPKSPQVEMSLCRGRGGDRNHDGRDTFVRHDGRDRVMRFLSTMREGLVRVIDRPHGAVGLTVVGLVSLMGLTGCGTYAASQPRFTSSGWVAPPPRTNPQDQAVNQSAGAQQPTSAAQASSGMADDDWEPVTPEEAEMMVSHLAAEADPMSATGSQARGMQAQGMQAPMQEQALPQVVWDQPEPQRPQAVTRQVDQSNRSNQPYQAAMAQGDRPVVEPALPTTVGRRDGVVYTVGNHHKVETPHAGSDVVEHVARTVANNASGSAGGNVGGGDVFHMMLDRIQRSEDPAVAKAVRMSVLSVFDPSQKALDPQVMAQLTPEQRRSVETYHNVVVTMAQALLEEGSESDLQAKLSGLADKHGEHTVKIQRVELCKNVRGFGVYEPFGSNTFVTGRNQPMIVYVELDDFMTKEHASDDFEVKLSQELILFNKSDGLAVWRQSPVEITDRSRNKRRDFFTVQMIELPPRLTVGQFTLKVRVTDMHGNSLDETNVPLDMVADRSLTSR